MGCTVPGKITAELHDTELTKFLESLAKKLSVYTYIHIYIDTHMCLPWPGLKFSKIISFRILSRMCEEFKFLPFNLEDKYLKMFPSTKDILFEKCLGENVDSNYVGHASILIMFSF